MKPFIIQLIVLIAPFFVYAQKGRIAGNEGKFQLNNICFIENKGQITDQYNNSRNDIQYEVCPTPGLNLFIGNCSIHYQFYKATGEHPRLRMKKAMADEAKFPPSLEKSYGGRGKIPNDVCEDYEMYRMDMALEGANPHAELIADEEQGYYENYYTTGMSGKDATASAYKRITYKDIYPSIDWVLYIKDGQMEYDFVVKPGGSVNDIRIRYNGATELQVAGDAITAITPMGKIEEGKLYCYEKEDDKTIASGFEMADNTVRLKTAKYKGTLVIDPRLQWATYYGGNLTTPSEIIADKTGNVCITGSTPSIAHIATTGAYQTVNNGNSDVYFAKFNTDGNIEWATYYGGSGDDGSNAVVVDTSGNIFIAGATNSTSNIATAGSYQNAYGGGGHDAFIAKFSPGGNLIWATYYGGSGDDGTTNITSDNLGNIYMTGFTTSTDSIATPDAYRTTYNDSDDAFIAKFSKSGSLIWATYFGGNGQNDAQSITCDSAENIYISGYTTSRIGIATVGAYQTAFSGDLYDVFIAKFTDSGVLSWSTYYGGNGEQQGAGIAATKTGCIDVTGFTTSTSGIATSGAYQTILTGETDAYVAQFTDNGTIVWATYYGGNKETGALCLCADNSGNIYMAGGTNSTEGIATPSAYEYDFSGAYDAFIAKFSSAGTLLWGTYYGSDSSNNCMSISCDDGGNFYITGETNCPEGVATANAYDTTYYGGASEASVTYIAKFDSLPTDGVPQINAVNAAFALYPNPATEIINVSWSSFGSPFGNAQSFGVAHPFGFTQDDRMRISVVNMEGQVVYATTVKASANHVTIPVSGLADGVYVCVVQSGAGRWYGRFTVVR